MGLSITDNKDDINLNDQSFTVPRGKILTLTQLRTRVITSSTNGSRRFDLSITTKEGKVYEYIPGSFVQKKNKDIIYSYMPVFSEGDKVQNRVINTMEDITKMFPESVLRIFDVNNIDPVGDSLEVSFLTSDNAVN